jgi:hypothetical protein
MTDLERHLTQLGHDLDWPPTPDIATAIHERLAAAAGDAAPRTDHGAFSAWRRRFALPPAGLRRSFVLAMLALLVLAGGVFAAVPSVRDAVLEFFGLQGATVERRERLPRLPEVRPLVLGERSTLEEARESLGFDPLVPAAAGRPDGVFVSRGVPGGELSLAYRPRDGLPRTRSTGLGLLVSQFRGDLSPDYFGKTAGEATRVEELRIDGRRAIWLEGAPHLFFYRPPDGPFREHDLRIAQNVLLVERGRLLVRLEGAFGRAKALELARSLR